MSNLVAQIGLSTANLINGMRRAGVFLLFFFVAGTFSCSKEKLPEGVLTQEELAAVMVKIYLAEARLSVSLIPRDSGEKLFHPFQEKLLKESGLSDSIMSKTYQYYLTHPKELELIYDSVIDTLSLREQRVKPPEAKTEAKNVVN